ncbi:MAG: hypothetical protein HRU14_01670 [Planctomycetes bacterium]|nr:hypothetical protein [Planctomycetota bacterium]
MADGQCTRAVVDELTQRIHFVGVGGTGMSALAQHRALGGLPTSGSDRALDEGALEDERARLSAIGIDLHPQDGTGVAGAARVVASTAVEAAIPDLAEARERGIPVIHRADVLAELLGGQPSIAIAGTSGKSTVTGMTFTILEEAGRDPGLVTGGDLVALRGRGLRGNAWRGDGPLVAEADESDGTLVKHAPLIGLVLNLHRDHMDPKHVMDQFQTFASQTRGRTLISDDAELAPMRDGARTFGFGPEAAVRGTALVTDGNGSRFSVGGVTVRVSLPGAYNASNALAAIAAGMAVDVDVATAARAIHGFLGVARRFEVVGERGGVTVVDDFAHNPTKIAAALSAARSRADRVLALFQPHGFAPARFMRDELSQTLPSVLGPDDLMWISEIHYAGGTATRDISSKDLADDLRTAGVDARYVADRDAWPELVGDVARPGDLILVMGARDPGLAALARRVMGSLPSAEGQPPSTPHEA